MHYALCFSDMLSSRVALADVGVTEWRIRRHRQRLFARVALADVGVIESTHITNAAILESFC